MLSYIERDLFRVFTWWYSGSKRDLIGDSEPYLDMLWLELRFELEPNFPVPALYSSFSLQQLKSDSELQCSCKGIAWSVVPGKTKILVIHQKLQSIPSLNTQSCIRSPLCSTCTQIWKFEYLLAYFEAKKLKKQTNSQKRYYASF